MQKINKGIAFAIALVLIASVMIYYRYAKDIIGGGKEEVTAVPTQKATEGLKSVSAEVTYGTPGDYDDHLRFIVTVDKQGMIQSIQTLDAETGEVPPKKVEFTTQINGILKGKKLSELTKIDKVGKSTMTTDAFNTALTELKSQL